VRDHSIPTLLTLHPELKMKKTDKIYKYKYKYKYKYIRLQQKQNKKEQLYWQNKQTNKQIELEEKAMNILKRNFAIVTEQNRTELLSYARALFFCSFAAMMPPALDSKEQFILIAAEFLALLVGFAVILYVFDFSAYSYHPCFMTLAVILLNQGVLASRFIKSSKR